MNEPRRAVPRRAGRPTIGDVIELRGLRALGVCGVLPEEQERPQPLEVDLDIVTDLHAASASDELEDTIDYGAVAARTEEIVTGQRFVLLERLAARIAEALLEDDRVSEVTVAVRKLRPPVPQHLATSGVRLTRAG